MDTLFACVHAAEFPAQALLRMRPDLQAHPVAVLEGKPPQESVCAMNRPAQRYGVALGMTELETDEIPGVHLLRRCLGTEAAARAVLLECVSRFSPRIEDVGQGTAAAFVLDIAGTERLFGTPAQLAERLRTALAAAGFRVSIAVSTDFHTARMKAAAMHGVAVIPGGRQADALAALPLTTLDLEEDPRLTFSLWGIRTLGELAALPEAELVSRLGAQARTWRALARGEQPHLFKPLEPEFALREYCAFETPVEQIDSLLFMGARMIDCLVARAADRALSLAWLTVRMELEDQKVHERVLRPATPSGDRKFLLKLLQLEIAAHPPQSAVLALELTAEAGQSGTVQLGLFSPQTPEPSRLDVTLARLRAIVGDDRVGSPMLEDTHRPGSFRMEPFLVGAPTAVVEPAPPRMAMRRVRPPRRVDVTVRAQRPTVFRDGESRYEVTSAYGPWKSNGCWWAAGAWDLEEWDVLAERYGGGSVACLLVWDRAAGAWRLEAFYD